MSNVVGVLRQRSRSIDATSARDVSRHSPPPFIDRWCVVARVALVARAISLASAALFSNDHSRVDLPLAGAGGLLVVNINQRPSRDACLPPVLLERPRTLRPVSATATARAAAVVFLVSLALQIGGMLSSTPPRTHPVVHSQGTGVAEFVGLTRELWPRAS